MKQRLHIDIADIYIVPVGTFIKMDVNVFLAENAHKKPDLFVSPF